MRSLLCLVACLLLSPIVFSQQVVQTGPALPDALGQPALQPEDYLAGIGHAVRNLDYKGVFTYEQGGQKTTQQWVHRVRDGVEHERLLGLDGAHREILRERPLGCLPSGMQGIQSHLANILTGKVNSLHEHYQVSLGRQETIAGRPATPVEITARDEYRYSYRLFADNETRLLLGADMLDHAGHLVERFRFISIFIGQVAAGDLKPVTASPARLSADECTTPLQQNPSLKTSWLFDMPGGYALCHSEKRHQNGVDEDVMIYSDGLNHLTVFVRHEALSEQGGRLQQGNTLLRSENVELDGRLFAVTVVGEIPEALARRVLSSVKPANGH